MPRVIEALTRAVVLSAALGGCMAARATGAQCRFNDDCASQLVCAGSVCRAQCVSERDCANGYQCVASGQADKRVCVPPGEPRPCLYTSDCDAPQVCQPSGQCDTQCLSDWDCQSRNPTLRCELASGTCTGAASDGGAE